LRGESGRIIKALLIGETDEKTCDGVVEGVRKQVNCRCFQKTFKFKTLAIKFYCCPIKMLRWQDGGKYLLQERFYIER
jgi:hypothetical protein